MVDNVMVADAVLGVVAAKVRRDDVGARRIVDALDVESARAGVSPLAASLAGVIRSGGSVLAPLDQVDAVSRMLLRPGERS